MTEIFYSVIRTFVSSFKAKKSSKLTTRIFKRFEAARYDFYFLRFPRKNDLEVRRGIELYPPRSIIETDGAIETKRALS